MVSFNLFYIGPIFFSLHVGNPFNVDTQVLGSVGVAQEFYREMIGSQAHP